MKEEDRKRVEEIMAGMRCPNNFKCVGSGFKEMCSVRKFGSEDCLECMEDNPAACSFSMPFGNTHFCQCPLREYGCKKLNK